MQQNVLRIILKKKNKLLQKVQEYIKNNPNILEKESHIVREFVEKNPDFVEGAKKIANDATKKMIEYLKSMIAELIQYKGVIDFNMAQNVISEALQMITPEHVKKALIHLRDWEDDATLSEVREEVLKITN